MKQFYGRFLSITVSIILSLSLQAQVQAAHPKPVVALEPGWIKELPQRLSTNINPNEVNGGYYFLQRVMQWNVATGETYYHNTYKITTDEGVQNSSELKFSWDPNFEKLQLHKAIVWRNGKQINKLEIAKVQVVQREGRMEQNIFDESLTAVVVLEDIRLGDIIEYAFTITGKNPVFNDRFFNSFNLQFYDPVDELLVHVVAPENRKINYKLYKTEQKPVIATRNGFTTYTWHALNLKATPVDEDTPSWYDAYPGVYLSEFDTWEQVAKWALPLYNQKEKLSSALIASIDSIRKENGSDEQRLVAALRFVQDEVRYLGFEAGIGGFKPRSPSEVFARRFGDCKDKSLLLVTMLREMGIEAYPALVNSSARGQIEHVLPTPFAFDHCIVQVSLWDKKFWYDPTSSKQRGSYDAIALPDYQRALVIDGATRKLAEVKVPAAGNGRVKVQEAFFFDNIGGPVKLEIKTEYYGSDADFQRSRFATTSLKEIEKSFLNYYASSYPDIEVSRDLDFIDYPYENKFTTLEEYTISELWQESAETENLITASFFPQVLRSYLSSPRVSKRSTPLNLNYPVQVEHEIQLYLPESWPTAPASREINDPAFNYSSKVTYNSTRKLLTMNYTYTTLADHVLPEQMAAFVKNQKAIIDDMGYTLSYNKNFAVADSPVSWPVVFLALLVLAAACYGGYRLYYFDPAPVAGYISGRNSDIGGWLVLVAIGICLTPLISVTSFFRNEYFNQTVWRELLSISSASFSPKLAFVAGLEMVLSIAQIVFNVVLVVLFMKRRTSVPRLAVIYYVSGFLIPVSLLAIMSALGLPTDSSSAGDIGRAFMVAAVWVPYFCLSHRVKETFVVQLQPALPQEVEEYAVEMATAGNG